MVLALSSGGFGGFGGWGGWVPDSSKSDLDERVDQWPQWGLFTLLGFPQAVAVHGEHSGPKVKRMHILPIIDGFVRFV